MLDIMRKHAKSWVINIIIGAIVVVFIFWGAGTFRQNEITKVATVNDEAIPMADFQEAYRQLYEMAKSQYRDYLNDELLQMLDLKRQAMDRLINEYLIIQQTKAMGLDVSKEELQATIAATPGFQVDGVFDVKRYQTMLSRYHYSPSDYELLVRRDLLSKKCIRLITSQAKVSEKEVRDFFNLYNDKADLEFVLFEGDKFRDQVKLTDEEIAAYFEKNKENYRIPPQARVAYVAFRSGDFEDKAAVSDDDLTDYYEINADEFSEPEMAHARHILFRVNENADPEEVAKAHDRADAVLKMAREGIDFAELAKEYSEGPTAKDGGDLGWFAKDQMVKPFSDAAFSMKIGEISELVRTQFGFHIIKLEERREARSRTFEEVKDELRTKLTREKAQEMAVDKANEAYEQAGLNQDLAPIAETMGLRVVETDFFAANTPVGDLGLAPKLAEVALGLEPGQIGPLVDMDDGQYLIKCLEKKDSYLPELTAVKPSVEEDLLSEKAAEKAKEAAQGFLTKAAQAGWEKTVEQDALIVEATGPFTRGETPPKVGANEKLKETVFALRTPGSLVEEAQPGMKGYYAFRIKEFTPTSDADFAEKKEVVTKNLLQRKGQTYLYQWLEELKAKSKIEIDERALS